MLRYVVASLPVLLRWQRWDLNSTSTKWASSLSFYIPHLLYIACYLIANEYLFGGRSTVGLKPYLTEMSINSISYKLLTHCLHTMSIWDLFPQNHIHVVQILSFKMILCVRVAVSVGVQKLLFVQKFLCFLLIIDMFSGPYLL